MRVDSLGDRLARGEQSAFAELYDACAGRLHAYLVSRLRSHSDADDVIQETFVRMARSRHKLARVENLTAYVFTIARREALRFAGRRSREYQGRVVGDVNELSSENADVPAQDTAELLAAALARLSPGEREVIELKTYGGLVLREISEVTGVPQGTIATRYRTALERLRTMLAKNIQ